MEPTLDAQFRPAAQRRFEAWLGLDERFELTRFVVLRLLGFVYCAAFTSLTWQVLPLIGAHGITPANLYVRSVHTFTGSSWQALLAEPSIFHFITPSDGALLGLSICGLALSILVLLGMSNALVMLTLWILYRSFVAVGQVWYGYGWELLLLESGFLCTFLCPIRSIRPWPRQQVPRALIWLLRWLALRVMLGAGLIKLRGDSCWSDLTCLDFHFETQPLPNPLSPYFHALPHGVLATGVLFNHFTELVCPLLILGPRATRHWAAAAMVAFQGVLIASGNLAFLNWLTIVPLLACWDDRALSVVLPTAWKTAALRATPAHRGHVRAAIGLAVLVALLSVRVLENMASSRQRMNGAFEPLMLVNTYGAFGGVGRERYELIIEGTRALTPDDSATWHAYQLPYKPGDLRRPHPIISPLQPRLDWQLWFAAMASPQDEPWLLHVVWKLLHADRQIRTLLSDDPFGEKPPRYVRIVRYRYRFAPTASELHWTRERKALWLPPLSANDELRSALLQLGYAVD